MPFNIGIWVSLVLVSMGKSGISSINIKGQLYIPTNQHLLGEEKRATLLYISIVAMKPKLIFCYLYNGNVKTCGLVKARHNDVYKLPSTGHRNHLPAWQLLCLIPSLCLQLTSSPLAQMLRWFWLTHRSLFLHIPQLWLFFFSLDLLVCS